MNQGQFIRSMEDFGKDLRRLLDGVNQPSILYGNVDSVDEESVPAHIVHKVVIKISNACLFKLFIKI